MPVGRFSLPEEKPQGLDAPLTSKLIKLGSRAQVRVFKLTNGRVGRTWRVGAGFKKPVPTLLLDHVGRKSGRTFTTPLLYLEDGPNLVIVASQGGLPKNPQWYPNLLAHPDTTVRVRKQGVRRVHAHTADADERAELWPRLVELYADFAKYEKWTDREIPIVVLEPH